jgi:hypothetical protein
MKLEQEVRHKSEDVDDEVLLDVVRALRRRVRIVSREYDVPYIAGYSKDGHTVFIDRHLPHSFRWLTKTVRVDPFLLTHEIVEKALLDELRLHYLHAHQIATRAERDAVKAAGAVAAAGAQGGVTMPLDKSAAAQFIANSDDELDLAAATSRASPLRQQPLGLPVDRTKFSGILDMLVG